MEQYAPSPEYAQYLSRVLQNKEKERLKEEMRSLCAIRANIEADIAFVGKYSPHKQDKLYEQCDKINAEIELVRSLLREFQDNTKEMCLLEEQNSES